MKLFISWSKTTSKEIAIELKKFMQDFFRSKSINIYMSAEKIEPGENWFDSIKGAIEGSDISVIVMTDENELSRWIYFEAGAIAFNTKSSNIIPLLITTRDIDRDSPLNHYQYIKNTKNDIFSLFNLIKKVGKLTGVRKDEFSERFDEYYKSFNEQVGLIVERSVTGAISHLPYGQIFPRDTTQVERGKVFVGAPMASHNSESDYAITKRGVCDVVEAIEICCHAVSRVYWAGSEIDSVKKFDGEQVALLRDLSQLKSSAFCIFMIFEKLPSSVLVEIGYAIALNKPIIIFCHTRNDLPFLLKRADNQISLLSIYECKNYAEIVDHFERDGEAMLVFPEST